LEAELDAHGLDRVHVLGNSLGGRLAIELAVRGRALSVVALSPSGLGLPPERIFQGALMTTARLLNKTRSPFIEPMSRSVLGRTALTAGLRAMPWKTTRAEALSVKGGFAESDGFWSMLWDAILIDVPTGLDRIDCPVTLGTGRPRYGRVGADRAVRPADPRGTVRAAPLGRPRAAVRLPRGHRRPRAPDRRADDRLLPVGLDLIDRPRLGGVRVVTELGLRAALS